MSSQQKGDGCAVPMYSTNMINMLGSMLGQMSNMGSASPIATLLSTATEMMSGRQGLQKAIVGIPVAAVPIPKTYRVYVHPDGIIIKCARDLDLQEQLEYFSIEYVEFVFATVISRSVVEVSSVCTNGYRVLLDCIKFDHEMKAFVYQYSYRKYVVEHGEVLELPIKRMNVPVIEVGEDRDSEAYVTKLFKIVPYTQSGVTSVVQYSIPTSTPTSTAFLKPVKSCIYVKLRKEISRHDILKHIKEIPNREGSKKYITIYQILQEEIDTKKFFYCYIYNSHVQNVNGDLEDGRHLEYESEVPMVKEQLLPIFKNLA